LWRKAFKKLDVEGIPIPLLEIDDGRDILDELLSLVRETEQKCHQKKWKWKNRGGQIIIVRDVFAKMVVWIQRFKAIGDVVVQYDPAHASLPWGFARFVLQVSRFSAHKSDADCARLPSTMLKGMRLCSKH